MYRVFSPQSIFSKSCSRNAQTNGNILSKIFYFCPILTKAQMCQHKLRNATTPNAVNTYFFSGFRFVVWEQTDRNMKKLVSECPPFFFTDTPPKYTGFTLLPMLITEEGKLIIRITLQLQIIKLVPTITKRSKSALPATFQALELCVKIPLSACLHACLLSLCCPAQLLDFRYFNLLPRFIIS